MTYSRKLAYPSVCVCLLAVFLVSAFNANAQERPRLVKQVSSQPINQPNSTQPAPNKVKSLSSSAPINAPAAASKIVTANENRTENTPLVKKTGDSSPLMSATRAAASRTVYGNSASNLIMDGISERLGIPYRYGSEGPNRYDCSGFVWSVFADAGINFDRTSARSIWQMSLPVEGDERFVFGTLVFFNRLGHMGIVADENGFYHASSSKGVTYSPFAGYWEKRIVGFRRLIIAPAEPTAPAADEESVTRK